MWQSVVDRPYIPLWNYGPAVWTAMFGASREAVIKGPELHYIFVGSALKTSNFDLHHPLFISFYITSAMQARRGVPMAVFSQSEMHMMMYYAGCRLETAARALRDIPVEHWPEAWHANLRVDLVGQHISSKTIWALYHIGPGCSNLFIGPVWPSAIDASLGPSLLITPDRPSRAGCRGAPCYLAGHREG